MTPRIRHFAWGAAAVIAVVTLVVLLAPAPRLAATNTRVIRSVGGVILAPKSERCQGGEYVPAEASRLQVYPGATSGTGPPLVVTVRNGAGRAVTRVRVPGGYPLSRPDRPAPPLSVPLPANRPTVELARLCFRNAGRSAISLAGNLGTANPATPGAVNGPGQRSAEEVRADFFLSGSRSGLSVAGRAVERATLLRPGFIGAWTIWALLALFLGACTAMVTWFVRNAEREA